MVVATMTELKMLANRRSSGTLSGKTRHWRTNTRHDPSITRQLPSRIPG